MTTTTTVVRPDTSASSFSPAARRLTHHLALGSRILAVGGHDDLNQGQISGRLPGADVFTIKEAVLGFCEATPESMIAASVDPGDRPHRMAPPELPLHQAIYRARPDVNAIVHSHAEATLVFGALRGVALPAISHDAAYFADRYAEYDLSSNTILTQADGEAVAAALGSDALALFLVNHGGVVVGRSVREAVIAADLLERACRLALSALAAGREFQTSSAEDIAQKQSYVYGPTAVKSYWDFCVRQAARLHPEISTWTRA